MIGRKSENKILLQNSVHTRSEEENSEKNSNKIQKIIKPIPSTIFSENGNEISRKSENKVLL